MKNVFFISVSIMLIFNSSSNLAQIPNAGFENWQSNYYFGLVPVGWVTSDGHAWINISRSYDSHSGNFAVEGTIGWEHTFAVSPEISTAFPINFRPKLFKGYYKFFPDNKRRKS